MQRTTALISALPLVLLGISRSAAENVRSFDGNWLATISCPNAAGALGYSYQFPAQIRDGVLRGEHLAAGHPGWLMLNGSIRPDGSAEDMAVVLADSVTPVLQAGLVDLVETDHRICDEVSLVPTPGHTPGHVSVSIVSNGEEGLITGDFMHHPCQIARPEWSSTADSDPAEAQQTRERMLTRLADAPILVIGTHFAGRTAGRVVREGEAYRLE